MSTDREFWSMTFGQVRALLLFHERATQCGPALLYVQQLNLHRSAPKGAPLPPPLQPHDVFPHLFDAPAAEVGPSNDADNIRAGLAMFMRFGAEISPEAKAELSKQLNGTE